MVAQDAQLGADDLALLLDLCGLVRDVRFWIAEPTYRGQASIGRS
jgi:hypothetical protein